MLFRSKIPLFNGALPCELRKYEIFDGRYNEFRGGDRRLKKDDLPTRRSSTLRHKARLAEKEEARKAGMTEKPEFTERTEKREFRKERTPRKTSDRKPFRKDGEKPFHKSEGRKPFRKSEGKKPFRKTEKKPFRNNKK